MEKDAIFRPEMKEELDRLKVSLQGAGSMLLASVAGLLFSLVMLFLTDFRTACMIGMASLLFDIMLARPARKKREKRLIADQALFGTGGMMSVCSYQEQYTLPNDIFLQLFLSDRSEWDIRPICRHRLCGTYIGSKVNICECSVGVKYGAKKGDIEFFSGTFITADGGKNHDSDIVYISEKAYKLTDGCKGYLSAGFHKRDDCTGVAEVLIKGCAAIPAWLHSGFDKLLRYGDRGVCLAYVDGKLAVFVQNSFYAEKMHSGTRATETILKQCRLRERDIVFEMIRKMQQ